jgi:outer membrane protein assembly factor BamB
VAGQDGDDDFGASPILTGVNDSAGNRILVEAGKSGYVYGLDEKSGTELWQTQAAEPGQLSPQLIGAVGGFIGSPALGSSNGQPAIFLTSAIFTPLSGLGADAGSPFPRCPSLAGEAVPACPDTSLAGNPQRLASVHAVSVASGKVIWQAPVSTPTYAPATYSNGVVFAPSTTSFAAAAYNADSGNPLWVFPLASSGASGAAIAGSNIYLGSGISESGQTFPGLSGIWSFTSG